MVKLMLLAGVTLSLVSAAVAKPLPKIEGSWPVAAIERMMEESQFPEEGNARCNADWHCTRTFIEFEINTRVDIAVKDGRVYRIVCVEGERCRSNDIWRMLRPPPSCYTYDSKRSILSGKVVARMAYGPDFGKMVPEPYYALVPDRPICLEQGSRDDEVNWEPAETNVTILQLARLGDPLLNKWLGKHATVTGQLWPGMTAHHHTKILMNVTRVAAK